MYTQCLATPLAGMHFLENNGQTCRTGSGAPAYGYAWSVLFPCCHGYYAIELPSGSSPITGNPLNYIHRLLNTYITVIIMTL